MAGILDQVMVMLALYLQALQSLWPRLYPAITIVLHVLGRDPELSGTVSASHDQKQPRPRTPLAAPPRDPLPRVGTLARVWADEQIAQQADQMARDLLSRPLSIDDVSTTGTDEHDGWPMLLGGFSQGGEDDGLQLRRLWSGTVVCDDARQSWL